MSWSDATNATTRFRTSQRSPTHAETAFLDTSRAREIFAEMVASGRSAADVVGAMEIAAVGEDELRDLCRELLARNPKIVADVQGGKEQAVAGLIGQARKQNANVNPGEFRTMCLEMIRAMGR